MMTSIPLVLGSLWALLPATAVAVLIVARTTLEDRSLKDELPGYQAYALKVRSKLIPRIW
jgi:protein-S-isoprenylcysteine O-methyltransferase Ste14